MAKVFVSHAHADLALVEDFCDDILSMGCGLGAGDLFVSSLPDHGVPSGSDLLSYVRSTVGTATLVVAIVSPTYPTRPVCVAELGAAWGVANKLFPVLVPRMRRDELGGVLEGLAVRYLNEESVLDELRDVLADLGVELPRQATWTRAKGKWLRKVDELADALPVPDVVPESALREAEAETSELREALGEAEAEIEKLKVQIVALAEAKDRDAVEEILLDDDERTRFEQHAEAARRAHAEVPAIVSDVIKSHIRTSDGMPYPVEDQWARDAADQAIAQGYLTYDEDTGSLRLSTKVRSVEDALHATQDLEWSLETASDSFAKWFRSQYGAEPDLSIGLVYDAILR